MANDPGSESGVPDEVSAWIADLADERGVTEQELMERLLLGDGVDAPIGPGEDVAELAERVDDLDAALSDLDDALDDQIQDVRDRVIQVKREADAKAPRDHDHPEFDEHLRRLGDNLDALGHDFVDLDADVDRIEEAVEDVDDRMSRGFSNYEEVLTYLVDVTDDLNRKVETLARTVVELRELTGRLEAADARRAGADRLRETAHSHGVTQAKCEDCGEPIHLALLTSPGCPHCDASFAQLDPNRGFFRSSVLRTGRRPALDGEVDPERSDLDAIVSEEVDAPPEVGPEVATSSTASDQEPADDGPASKWDEPVAGTDVSPDTDEEHGGTESDEVDADDDGRIGTGGDGDGRPTAGVGGAADLPVDDVPGIGSAYAERLGAAGVETVGALALSDPTRLAEQTDVARGRVDRWVRQAREMVEAD